MTKKEKLVEDWFIRNRELNIKGEGTFSQNEAFLAGFDTARDEIADFIYKLNGEAKAFTRSSILEIGENEVED